jgi:hypothetical protein
MMRVLVVGGLLGLLFGGVAGAALAAGDVAECAPPGSAAAAIYQLRPAALMRCLIEHGQSEAEVRRRIGIPSSEELRDGLKVYYYGGNRARASFVQFANEAGVWRVVGLRDKTTLR